MKKKTTARKKTRRAPGKRNKKLQAEGFRMPASVSLLVVMVFGVGLLYLWCCSRTEALGRQIKSEEQALEDLRRQVAGEEVRWNGLIGPRNLRAALKTHKLNMNWPRPDQVMHIRDMALWESTAGELNVLGSLDRNERGVRY
ncbi:hypothetical protein P0Y35_13450 [Kiritimatiellaeota bacterium B1221]|nr:hypothetical protein [Kiritimatiellaeota bacterium B1221]